MDFTFLPGEVNLNQERLGLPLDPDRLAVLSGEIVAEQGYPAITYGW